MSRSALLEQELKAKAMQASRAADFFIVIGSFQGNDAAVIHTRNPQLLASRSQEIESAILTSPVICINTNTPR